MTGGVRALIQSKLPLFPPAGAAAGLLTHRRHQLLEAYQVQHPLEVVRQRHQAPFRPHFHQPFQTEKLRRDLNSMDVEQKSRATIDDLIPPHAIFFHGVPVAQVLAIYTNLSTAEMDIEESVWRNPVLLMFENTNAISRSEAIGLLEKTFHEQAGIDITHLETNQTVFRYRR